MLSSMLEQSAMARTLLLWEGFLLKFDWLIGDCRAQSSSAEERNTTESLVFLLETVITKMVYRAVENITASLDFS